MFLRHWSEFGRFLCSVTERTKENRCSEDLSTDMGCSQAVVDRLSISIGAVEAETICDLFIIIVEFINF